LQTFIDNLGLDIEVAPGNSDSWISGSFASQSRPEGRLQEQ
jgi:hypothetical protein